ncbi:MAG: molybdate ABC transporter substrate-binding protein [Caulobacteraceae bacterium]
MAAPTRRGSLVLAGGAVAAALLPAPSWAAGAPVEVFAAASLKDALDAADAAWTRRSGVPVRGSYGASSTIARQIEEGAPADLFVSADVQWMDWAARRGLIRAGTRRDLLANRLALIAPRGSRVTLAIAKGMPLARVLAKAPGGGGRLAVAGPEVPAGIYAKAALTALGVWPSVEAHLAPAENVRAALAYVALGEAPLGIVYRTDALSEPKVKIVGLFPEWTHPKILYPAAITAASRNLAAARLLAFLEGPEAAAIFARFGFAPLMGR